MDDRGMDEVLHVKGLRVGVTRKRIRNMYLRVVPPHGEVMIRAPLRVSTDSIRRFVVAKLPWIHKHQEVVRRQEWEPPRRYHERELQRVWGERLPLRVVEREGAPKVKVAGGEVVLWVPPGAGVSLRRTALENWYAQQTLDAAMALIPKWERILGVRVDQLFARRMKTLWGSCHRGKRAIRLNSELAKRPRELLEYILVHEMMHLLEDSHGPRFAALRRRYQPEWREMDAELRRVPIGV